MNLTLEQLADMPHIFSRKKSATELQYSIEELKARSRALAQKKSDADSGLKISDEEAARYEEIATAIEGAVSHLFDKFKKSSCVTSPVSKEYDQSLQDFCGLNGQIYDIITDAKHAMELSQKIIKSLPKQDPKIHSDLKMSEFISSLS